MAPSQDNLAPRADPATPRPDIADFSIAIAAGLGIALATLFLCVLPLAGDISGARDFVSYWATGQQLLHHANPYDPVVMLHIERAAGLPAAYGVLYMRNPPWGLLLALPLGLIPLRAAAFLWSLILVACLALSVRLLWIMQGRPAGRIHWIGFAFAPALVCLLVGQTSLFALLGYVLFLHLHRTRPFVAGASLWFCTLKPQLFLPFAAILLVWIVVSRSLKLLAGFVAAMAASCVVVTLLNPQNWNHYSQMMAAPNIRQEFIPCLSLVLRSMLAPHILWLQYLPAALACLWSLAYFWPRRARWDWLRHGSLPILLAILLAPYCWLYDQGLVLPALFQAAYATRSRALLAILAILSVVIEVQLVSGIKIPSIFYLWTAPAWLAWYLLARAFATKPQSQDVPQ